MSCPTCNEDGSFPAECERCLRPVCEDCERFIQAMTYCWECAPIIRAEIAEEEEKLPSVVEPLHQTTITAVSGDFILSA